MYFFVYAFMGSYAKGYVRCTQISLGPNTLELAEVFPFILDPFHALTDIYA